MNEQKDRLDSVIKQVYTKMKKTSDRPVVCPEEELLGAFFEGSLTEEKRNKIEEHLVYCDKCTEILLSFPDMERSDFAAEDAFINKKMVKRAKDLVKQKESPSFLEKLSSWFPIFKPVPMMAFTSAFLAVIVAGIFFLQSPHDPSSEIPLAMKFGLMKRMEVRGTTPSDNWIDIQENGSLRSGDSFRIKFELQEESYVYLVYLDSLGNLTKIFPKDDLTPPTKFKPQKAYVIPENKDQYWRLDDNIGHETVYLIASSEVIENFDRITDQLKKAGVHNITKAIPGVSAQAFSFIHE